jgi:hypothetical protein
MHHNAPEGVTIDEPAAPSPALLRQALNHGSVVAAFADDRLGDDDSEGNRGLETFAEELADLGEEAHGPSLYLRARIAEENGRMEDAEALYREARQHDPGWPFTVTALARMASERGDAAGAISLLRGAGMPPEHPLLHFLTHDIPNFTNVGRNEPCPCGSGRKYKQCCINDPKIPLARRVGWLMYKVSRLTDEGSGRASVIDLVDVADTAAGGDMFEELVIDGFLDDVATFEGGGLKVYLSRRGSLLPADERALAESWLLSARRLWEVVSVKDGASVTVRDALSGETVVVTEPSAGQWKVGELVMARVVDVEGAHLFIGTPVDVDGPERGPVVSLLDSDPTAEDLALWYGHMVHTMQLAEIAPRST